MYNERQLRAFYNQILLGASKGKALGRVGFIKHIDSSIQSGIDDDYDSAFALAISKELATEKERIASLEADGVWSPADEKEIETHREYLAQLRKAKSSQALPSQIASIDAQIKERESQLEDKLIARFELIGMTAEMFANKRANEKYLLRSLFADERLSVPLFSPEEFDELALEDISELSDGFRGELNKLSDSALRRVAIWRGFQQPFSLSDGKVSEFLGRPTSQLTFLQTDLLQYGQFFKHILSDASKIPEHLLTDPDKLIDWYNSSKNASALMEKTAHQNVAIVGATKEDMQHIAPEGTKAVSLNELAGDKKKMRGKELMKLLSGQV